MGQKHSGWAPTQSGTRASSAGRTSASTRNTGPMPNPWRGEPFTPDQLQQAMAEADQASRKLGVVHTP